MSAHILLYLLNELGNTDEMRGLPSLLSLFHSEFNKLNNTRAQLLDSCGFNIFLLLRFFV